MSIVQFCAEALGLTLTVGQRAFVRVAVDRASMDELSDDEKAAALDMWGPLGDVPAVARRTVVAAFGRDSGKTELASAIGLYLALTVDLSKCGPGDMPRAFVVAPDLDTARLTLERALARIEASEALHDRLVGAPSTLGFTLRRLDGRLVRFEVRAASRGGKTIRGRSIVALILDEASLFYGEGYTVNDREIVKAGRPRLLPGGLILLASTPWAEDGLFFELFDKNHGKPRAALAARASTLVMRDHDPEVHERIELEREEDPDNAAREYDAQFIGTGSSLFFEPEAIARAMAPTSAADDWTHKAAGADLALMRDCSALAVVGARTEEDGRVIFGLVDTEIHAPKKGEPLLLGAVVASFTAKLVKHGLDTMSADSHQREQARRYADELGVTIEAAPEGRDAKWETYATVRRLLAEGRLVLPEDARLAAQLRAIRSRPMSGGGYKVTSPRRAGQGHGDLVSALVLAVAAAHNRAGGHQFELDEDEPHYRSESRWEHNARGF